MKVTAVVHRGQPTPGMATAAEPRVLLHVDDLARSLGSTLRVDIPVIEGRLSDAPNLGFVLAFGLERELDRETGPRVVSFDEDRATVMKRLEDGALAGAVEKQQYFHWWSHREHESDARASGLIGRKDVARHMGARILTGPYTSAHYAALASDAPGNLITLLAAYLTAYSELDRSSSPPKRAL